MAEAYTNRQLYEIVEGLRDDVKQGFIGVHVRQDKTNGNVRSLEKRFWAIAGGLIVVSIIVVPIFLKMVN